MHLKIRDLMTTGVTTCSSNQTCTEAAQKMKQENVGSVPVVDGTSLTGIVTDRDIILNCVATSGDCNTTPISAVMTRNPISCTPNTDAHEAAQLMSNEQIRRLPVVDNGQLVGMCSLADLATVHIHVNEAGQALSDISEPSAYH